MDEQTELQRACPTCGSPLTAASDLCPRCALGGNPTPKAAHATARDSQTVSIRFEHFEVVVRDGKPVELGRGGMGVTYKAIDTNLRRPVALKVIKAANWDTERIRQRFVAEARAAAGLRHPNIASVFHLGKSGEDYFYAMELVEGEPLDRILRFRGPLEIGLVLQIADQIAAALSAAYKSGLVHRDIKPGNLMIMFGEQGKISVKVIDFGLAQRMRLSDQHPDDPYPGEFCGTPQFASPEQCEGKETDIRSDLYSLGITMWVMLSGKLPFQGDLREIIRKQESEVPPFEALEHVPRPVVELLKSLLDKEPAKRPQTPLELQSRIRALKTGPGNRHRWKSWSLYGASLLVLIAALGALFWQSQRHSEEQMRALQSKVDKLEEGVESFVDAQNKVRQQETNSKPDQLDRATYQELAKELNLDPEVLEKQLPRFAQELKKSPKATAYERANDAYVERDYDEAERLALVAVGEAQSAAPPKTSETIKALELAAWAADRRLNYADALTHLRKAEQFTDRRRDPEQWSRIQFAIAYVLNHQGHYREEEPILIQVVSERQRTLGPEHPDTLSTRQNLALVLQHEGKYTEAENEYRTVLALQDKLLGPEHPDTLTTRDNLALALEEQGKYAQAEPEFRAVLALRQKVLGPNSPETLRSWNNLALSLEEQGEYSKAETEYRALLSIAGRVLGPEHPITLGARNDLGLVLKEQGKYADAETEFRAVLVQAEKTLGPENPDTLATRDNLALVVEDEGKYADAEAELRTVLGLEEKALGPEDLNTLQIRRDLAMDLFKEGKYAESETELRNVLALMEKKNGSAHPETLQTCFDLALCLHAENKTEETKALAERAAKEAEKVLGIDHPDTKKYRQFFDSLR